MVPPQPNSKDGASPVGLAAHPSVALGQTWSLDASDLDPSLLEGKEGLRALQALFADLIRVLDLNPVGEPLWHVFDGGDYHGVTGVVALSESHLACHTFPEHGAMTLDLYTCRERTAPRWDELIARHLGSIVGPPTIALRVHRRGLSPRRSAPGTNR